MAPRSPAAVDPATSAAPRARAAALPAGERRAAVVAAALPLLRAHGSAVTTKQIAEAAGIAEGTIFRVFADKDDLIAAAIETAFDPAPLDEALRAIDLELPLEARLVDAVDCLHRRVERIWELTNAVGMAKVLEARGGDRRPGDLSALAALFAPDQDRIDRNPMQAAELLRALTFAGSHPALIVDQPLSADEIVSVLLDGIRSRPGPRADGASGRPPPPPRRPSEPTETPSP